MNSQSILKTISLATALGAVAVLSGCSTVRIPNVDFLKLPEFREDANNIKDYPKVSDAPLAPTDVRSAAQWDADAKAIIAKRDAERAAGEIADAPVVPLSPEEQAALKAKVRAYKLDDPQ